MKLALKTADTAMRSDPLKILVVDDEIRMCESLEALLGGEGYEVHICQSGKEAVEHLAKNRFDLVLLDVVMPDMDGHQVMGYTHSQDPDTLIILMTGHASMDSTVEALRGGAHDYLRKPFEPQELLKAVKTALNQKRLKVGYEALQESEEKYRTLFNSGSDAVFVWQITKDGYPGRLIEVNEIACQKYGVTKAEFLNLSPGDIGLLEKSATVPKFLDKLLSERFILFESEHITISGKRFPVEINSHLFELGGEFAVMSIVRDITERKRAEEDLKRTKVELERVLNEVRQERDKLHALMNSIADEVWFCDAQGNLSLANVAAARGLGFKRVEEVLQPMPEWLSRLEIYSSDGHPRAMEDAPLLRSLRGETLRFVEEIVRHPISGEILYRQVSSAPLKSEAGEIMGAVAVVRDISQRKLAEEALRESKEFTENLISNMKDGFSVLDNRGIHVHVNAALCQMTGFGRDELIGIGPPHPYWPEEEDQSIQRTFQSTLRGEFEDFEVIFKRKNGERFPVIVSPSMVLDKKGNVINYLATVKDITERKQAEEMLQEARDELERRVEERTADMVRATEQLKLELNERKQAEKKLRESEERLQSIVDKTTAAIYLKDLHGRFILVNRQVEKILDMSREDIIGKTNYDISPKELADKIWANDRKALEAETAVEFEEVAKLKDGLHTYISIKVPLFDSAGRAYGVCGISTDITERKKVEELLQTRTRDLGERVKELNCLYSISELSRRQDIPLEATLQAIVDGIPSAWQYPEITCARVVLEGQEFTTENFRQTIHKQASKIIIDHEHAGTLEVSYLEEKPERDEGPFLKEERGLLEAIADQLARLIERKRAEGEIRSLAKFPSENSNPVLRVARSGTILYANEAGLPLLNVWGCNIGQPLPDEWCQFVLDVLSSGSSKNTEVEFEGRVFSLTFAPVVDGEYVNLYGFEITQRKRAEEQIRRLSHELLVAQESEWQRISRELHDVLGQELSVLKIGIDTFFDNQPEAPHETRQRLSELSKKLQKAIATVRDLSHALRCTGLDKRGLVSTLRSYCEAFSPGKRLKVDFLATGIDESRLDFNTKINLYRIIQEGLNNVEKHADAKHVTIRLVESFPNIILRIEDDGKGFDVQDRLISASHERRMGLRIMEERAALLQGKMKVYSVPTRGTKIVVEVPYKEKNLGGKENHLDC